MRLLIWNMNRTAHSWEWLANRADVDLALLQEAKRPPSEDSGFRSHVWRPKPGRSWGSAVVARDVELEPIVPSESFPWLAALSGSTAIARVPGNGLRLASVHLHHKVASAELAQRLSVDGVELSPIVGGGDGVWEHNVVPHELHRLFGNDRFVWGGDFNSDPRMDQVGGFGGGNARLFEIYREAGSVDPRPRFHEEPQQTFFPARARVPWQLDHVLADPATEARVTSYEVELEPTLSSPRCSDHAPIIIDIDTRPTDPDESL